MKVVLYPRVSDLKQLRGDSIEAQVHRMKAFCAERGHEIVDTIMDDAGRSASLAKDMIKVGLRKTDPTSHFADFLSAMINISSRPGFQKILHGAGIGSFEGIVFFKWDRLSRNLVFQELAKIYLSSKGISLIPTDDPIDPLMVRIKSALSEEEVVRLKDRLRLTNMKKFDEGIMVGRGMTGYRWNSRLKRMELDPRRAAIVRDVFAMTAAGQSYKEICAKHKLKPQSYYNMIRNPVYIGFIEFEGQRRKGIHEPLVSPELFEQANRRIGKGAAQVPPVTLPEEAPPFPALAPAESERPSQLAPELVPFPDPAPAEDSQDN